MQGREELSDLPTLPVPEGSLPSSASPSAPGAATATPMERSYGRPAPGTTLGHRATGSTPERPWPRAPWPWTAPVTATEPTLPAAIPLASLKSQPARKPAARLVAGAAQALRPPGMKMAETAPPPLSGVSLLALAAEVAEAPLSGVSSLVLASEMLPA